MLSWALQLLLSLSFIWSVLTRELAGNPETLRHFTSFGFTKAFMFFIGVVELLGGIGLLIPYFTVAAATGLVVIMAGATYSHLVLAGDPWYTGVPSVITGLLLLLLIRVRWSMAGKRYFLLN
jgi:uncharacterized membrane protein YphA (DoxX/SURF4 family)